jgi:hypothetical protein
VKRKKSSSDGREIWTNFWRFRGIQWDLYNEILPRKMDMIPSGNWKWPVWFDDLPFKNGDVPQLY